MTGSAVSVAIVVLNYNNAPDTVACVNSLLNATVPQRTKIFVVDNGSSDDSLAVLDKHLTRQWNTTACDQQPIVPSAEVVLIASPKNGGYAYGNNLGCSLALGWGADFLWILNNDTRVHPHSLRKMLQLARQNDRLGVIGARLTRYDNLDEVVDPGMRSINLLTSSSRPLPHVTNVTVDRRGFQLPYVSGACMLIPSDAFKAVGGLREEFFLFFEEVDFCRRLIAEGYHLAVCEDARVGHRVGAASGASIGARSVRPVTSYHSTRSAILFYRSHFPYLTVLVVLSRATFAVTNILRLSVFRNILRGIWHGLYGVKPGPLR